MRFSVARLRGVANTKPVIADVRSGVAEQHVAVKLVQRAQEIGRRDA
jgi:hypothetical protein